MDGQCPKKRLIRSLWWSGSAFGANAINVLIGILSTGPWWMLLLSLILAMLCWYRFRATLFELQEHVFAEGYYAAASDFSAILTVVNAPQELRDKMAEVVAEGDSFENGEAGD
jgi:hypothetical protein